MMSVVAIHFFIHNNSSFRLIELLKYDAPPYDGLEGSNHRFGFFVRGVHFSILVTMLI